MRAKKLSNILPLGLFIIIIWTIISANENILICKSENIINVNTSDTTPPQLSIYTHGGNIGNSKALIHGISYDENGVQKVTVNGEEAKGNWTSVHFFWLKEVYLDEGENKITVICYDNSTNHNSYSENVTLNYKPDLYQGPTVRIIPVETMPSNNATLRCVVNPNGYPTSVRLWYGEKRYGYSPFNHGREDLCPLLTGMEEISLNYTLEREEEPYVGDQFLYVFIVENNRGFTYSEIGSFYVSEPIELPPESDNTPPVLEIGSFCGWSEFNVPNSSIIIHGSAYDENGILKVEVNGEVTYGDINENWNFWQMKLNLTEGINHIVVKAYDNSENHNWIENSVNITYQKENYLGPTISIIPVEYIPINKPTIKCIINPNGVDYTYAYIWFSRSSYENAPFQHGLYLGHQYDGTENILINYHLGVDHSIQVGDLITYMFRVSNNEGLAQTCIATVSVIDPDNIPPSPPLPIPPLPPILSDLTIIPDEVELGDNVTIGLDIENIDSQSFTYIVTMKIGELTLLVDVELGTYESKTVSHTITLGTVGDFNVTVDGLTGSFKVKSPEPPLRPAEFEISDLTITPLEVEPGEEVEISLLVKNIGEQQGSYMLSVLIENGQIFSWVSWIDLDGGTNETVRFRFKPEAEGTYKVEFNELVGNFTVKAVPEPAEFTVSDLSQFISIEEGADITIFVNVSNVGDVEGTHQVDLKLDGEVVYSINMTLPGGATEEVPLWIEGGLTVGTYQVEVEGLTDSFTVEPKPSFWDEIPGFPYESIIIGLIAVIIIIWRARKFYTVMRPRTALKL